MATVTVSLPEPMKTWIEDQMRAGRYSDASDYVRDLIRRDQDRQDAVADLQHPVDEGLSSGPGQAIDVDSFLAARRPALSDR